MSDKYRIFIDPASRSSGWAIFHGKSLVQHGTVEAHDKKDSIEFRLRDVMMKYMDVVNCHADMYETKFESCHIEQLVRMTHIYTHWSVGVIMAAVLSTDHVHKVAADIPISSWEKYTQWNTDKAPIYKALQSSTKKIASEDELAAIGIGLYWTNKYL